MPAPSAPRIRGKHPSQGALPARSAKSMRLTAAAFNLMMTSSSDCSAGSSLSS
jgi:hypothetical protein